MVREGEATTWHVSVDGSGGPRRGGGRSARGAGVDGPAALSTVRSSSTCATTATQPLDVVVRSTRWGCRRVGPALVVASSGWAGFRWTSRNEARRIDARHAPAAVAVRRCRATRARPGPRRSEPLAAPGRRQRVRQHSSVPARRPAAAHPLGTSLRTGTLHVTSTWADHDRHVVLLIDALDEVGESEGIDGPRVEPGHHDARGRRDRRALHQRRRPGRAGGARRPRRATSAASDRVSPSAPIAGGDGQRPASATHSSTTGECRAAWAKVRWS